MFPVFSVLSLSLLSSMFSCSPCLRRTAPNTNDQISPSGLCETVIRREAFRPNTVDAGYKNISVIRTIVCDPFLSFPIEKDPDIRTYRI